MQHWLSKRLTPSKSKETRWDSFASALETLWEDNFDPHYSRLERLRSSYLADDADLAKKVREMGDYFASDMPLIQDRPIAVAWRRLELEYKDLELIVTSVFRRHFGNLPTTWFPMFAPLDEEYGMTFVAAEGPWPELKNIPPEGLWLTSRGMLGTDYGHLLKLGYTKAAFLEKAVPLLLRTKPLHIVYDGPLFYIRFDIPFELKFSVYWERDLWSVLPVRPVQMEWREGERDNFTDIPFLGSDYQQAWHLDWRPPAAFSPHWLPPDILLGGIEGEKVAAFRIYLCEVSEPYLLTIPSMSVDLASKEKVSLASTPWVASLHSDQNTEAAPNFPFFPEKLWEEGFAPQSPEGWLPHDFVLSGSEGSSIPRSSLYLQDHERAFSTSVSAQISPAFTQQNDFALPLEPSVLSQAEAIDSFSLLYEQNHNIPSYACFDRIPADFCQLDMPIIPMGGFHA